MMADISAGQFFVILVMLAVIVGFFAGYLLHRVSRILEDYECRNSDDGGYE
jgi:NhaP-type Na+/H+ or K+/H+ antiporter